MTDSPAPRPDPWAVVEHHAREAASRGGHGEQLDTLQRLALYSATAPEVIGARRVEPGTLGHTVRRAGGTEAEWWAATLPRDTRELAWSSTGLLALKHPARRQVVAFGIAMLGFLLAFGAFGRLAGPRALVPAVVVFAGLFIAVRRSASDWTLLDGLASEPAVRGAVESWVAKYEEGVIGDTGRA